MRLIDSDRLLTDKMKSMYYHLQNGDIAIPIIDIEHAPTIEAIPKEQYETRLKADMVAMLEDLKQDFIAEAYGIEIDCTDYVVNVADIDKVIQEKINELKGDKNEV